MNKNHLARMALLHASLAACAQPAKPIPAAPVPQKQ